MFMFAASCVFAGDRENLFITNVTTDYPVITPFIFK